MRTKIKMIQADIDEANQRKTEYSFAITKRCPVTNALNRSFPNKKFDTGYTFTSDDSGKEYDLYGTSEFVEKWDSGETVEPIEFEIEERA